jgi:hypothetical protein
MQQGKAGMWVQPSDGGVAAIFDLKHGVWGGWVGGRELLQGLGSAHLQVDG